MKEIGDELRAIMSEQGVTQAKLAEGLGCSNKTVCRKLKEPGTFTLNELAEIATLLGVGMEIIFPKR